MKRVTFLNSENDFISFVEFCLNTVFKFNPNQKSGIQGWDSTYEEKIEEIINNSTNIN
jgi:hypothetical protein